MMDMDNMAAANSMVVVVHDVHNTGVLGALVADDKKMDMDKAFYTSSYTPLFLFRTIIFYAVHFGGVRFLNSHYQFYNLFAIPKVCLSFSLWNPNIALYSPSINVAGVPKISIPCNSFRCSL